MSLTRNLWIGLAIAALAVPVDLARAQNNNGPIGPIGPVQQRQIPVPTARIPDVGADLSQSHPDTHTLASIETLGIGTLGALTNFVDPSFRFTQAGDTVTTPKWNGSSSLGMNLAFDRNWERSHLNGFYRGTKILAYPNSLGNATYHNFFIAEEYQANRWVFRVREDLLSSPDASLDITGLVLAGAAGMVNALQPAGGAGDTILTQRAKRLRSTTSGEVNYYLSRRSILTGVGSYSSLTFSNAGFIDTHRTGARVGYDYLLSPRDMIGLMYDYSRITFSGVSSVVQTNSVQLAFGRRMTGRLAFQANGGPQQVTLGAGNRQLTWTVSNNLIYQTRRTQYTLSYAHFSSGGSGVFFGTSNHTVNANVRYSVSQWWTASATAGYSFDRALSPAVGVVNHIGTWHGYASLERAIGRHLQFTMNYGFQQQSPGAGACPATGCGPTTLRQTAGITLEWHPFSGAR